MKLVLAVLLINARIIAGTGIQCVALGMAEICSSMPTSGGLYYASAVLAPPGTFLAHDKIEGVY